VPGWGTILPPSQVFGEMAAVGLRATELGPIGYLPFDAGSIAAGLQPHGLRLLAAFVPLVLHEPDAAVALEDAAALAATLAAAGAERFVVALIADAAWSAPRPLDEAEWRRLAERLDALGAVVSAVGLTLALHPHAGTLIETAEQVARIGELSNVGWCLDPGHLAIGGVDPVAFTLQHAARIVHVHLKDVDAAVAQRLRTGELSLMEATQAGLFPPLGTGDVAIPDVLNALRDIGYDGWVVLEQDLALDGDAEAVGDAPLRAAQANVAYLERLGAVAPGRVGV
jgi:inosose dehydratase